MTEIVVNRCFGGFSISDEALKLYHEKKGITLYWKDGKWGSNAYTSPTFEDDSYVSEYTLGENRDDATLIEVVRELSKAANGRYAELQIVEIPDDVEWTIQEYDGQEWVAEKHRTW